MYHFWQWNLGAEGPACFFEDAVQVEGLGLSIADDSESGQDLSHLPDSLQAHNRTSGEVQMNNSLLPSYSLIRV